MPGRSPRRYSLIAGPRRDCLRDRYKRRRSRDNRRCTRRAARAARYTRCRRCARTLRQRSAVTAGRHISASARKTRRSRHSDRARCERRAAPQRPRVLAFSYKAEFGRARRAVRHSRRNAGAMPRICPTPSSGGSKKCSRLDGRRRLGSADRGRHGAPRSRSARQGGQHGRRGRFYGCGLCQRISYRQRLCLGAATRHCCGSCDGILRGTRTGRADKSAARRSGGCLLMINL